MSAKLFPLLARQHVRPLYATDGEPLRTRKVPVKFFTPDAQWTWLVLEGSPVNDAAGVAVDYTFFGLVQGHETELGYFMLSELASARGPLGLPVERDIHWSPETTLEQAAPEYIERRYDR